jgi:cytochrome oxidase Cu insertion factor (SCO1/SenC/PrrC family)
MRRGQGILGTLLILGALGWGGCGEGIPIGPQVGNRAPLFALEDTTGQTVRLQDYWGQPVVLVFYRTSG